MKVNEPLPSWNAGTFLIAYSSSMNQMYISRGLIQETKDFLI